jgi:hypothetical protein
MVLKESSLSSRWDTDSMDAAERNMIYVPEFGCTLGQCWGSLRKAWVQLRVALRNGDFERVEMLKERIYNLRESMGIPNEELY